MRRTFAWASGLSEGDAAHPQRGPRDEEAEVEGAEEGNEVLRRVTRLAPASL